MASTADVPKDGTASPGTDRSGAIDADVSEADASEAGAAEIHASGARASEISADRTARRRPRPWAELLILLLCYGAYTAVRNVVPTDHAMAAHRAYALLDVEYAMNLDMEYALNRLFAAHGWLAVGANYYYASLHFLVTIGVLVRLYTRHPDRYRTYRTILFATTLIGLAGFWLFPLAPPRMLPAFTDTVVAFGSWGIYESGPTAAVSNQYAAMPSMHTAWSLWCAVAVIGIARHRWTVALAVLYPALTVVVIMGTANHYLLDAVGGAAALAGGYAIGRGLFLVVRAAVPQRL